MQKHWQIFVLNAALALVLASCSGSQLPGIPTSQPFALPAEGARYNVLVFSHTARYRHESIEQGVQLVNDFGAEHDFSVVATEDPTTFTDTYLASFDVVVFMNTNGDVLGPDQEAAFERYIKNGGNYVGVHSAAATEYDWEWYGGLVGAHFDEHPKPQEADVLVLDGVHPSTAHLPKRWTHFDEWYNYRWNPRSQVHVLATLDEDSYQGGKMGHDHPIAWAHEYDGGRAWYTGLGHTIEVYSDPLFQQHLLGGIEWAAGMADGDVHATLAEHYEKKVLMDAVTDPMEIAIAEDGRVFLVERAGAIKMWHPETEETSLVGWIPVYMVIEDGLLGIALDPDFMDNNWIYVFYAPKDAGPSRLSRFSLVNNTLDMSSEIVLLEVDVQRKLCCHAGGSITFDAQGNLYLSTGDNSSVADNQGSPIDERPGERFGDAQRSSANTNDLRGKILRIHPRSDGTYAIPEGNLFAGDSLHRPEIYTMGHRNPFRIAVDRETGWLYWGDVGSGDPPNDRGGWGWDEFNQARGPGNFGWPQFTGKNQPYKRFNYETGEIGDPFNPERPMNSSPNNTGARQLPPAQPAWIWYTYGNGGEHPELGNGGINPMAGPVYRKPDQPGPYALPEYFEGTHFIYEWMRNWIKEVKMDEQGNITEISPFLPGIDFVRPMDMEVGPDGALYVAEWGDAFWGSNENAQVVRLEYHGGDRKHAEVLAERVDDVDPISSLPSVQIESPTHGDFFDFDEQMPYKITVTTPSGETIAEDRVEVSVFSGFDTHALLLDTYQGSEGTFAVTREFTHTPDLHLMDRFAEVHACYTDEEGQRGCNRITLNPTLREAEHVKWHKGVTRHTYGTHPASEMFPITAMITMQMSSGDSLAYGPLHLEEIASVTLRYKQHRNGTIVLSESGNEVARVELNEVDAETIKEVEQIIEADNAMRYDEALNDENLDRSIYENWSEVTIPVSSSGDKNELMLSVEGRGSSMILELDWIRFNKKE